MYTQACVPRRYAIVNIVVEEYMYDNGNEYYSISYEFTHVTDVCFEMMHHIKCRSLLEFIGAKPLSQIANTKMNLLSQKNRVMCTINCCLTIEDWYQKISSLRETVSVLV